MKRDAESIAKKMRVNDSLGKCSVRKVQTSFRDRRNKPPCTALAVCIVILLWIGAPVLLETLVEPHVSAEGSSLIGIYNSTNMPFNAISDAVLTTPCVPAGLDPTFGTGGKVVTPIGSGDDNAYSMAIQPDGRIVMAGRSNNGSVFDFAVARYNINGTLDTTFHGTGKATTPIGGGGTAFAVAVQADGRIVAAGRTNNGTNADFAVIRYNTDGSLDFTFNGTGKVTTPIGSGDDIGDSVAIQADGRIVLAGYSFNGVDQDIALVRYNTDGTLDTTFNGTGKVTTPIGTIHDQAFAVAIQTDGRIVVSGQSADPVQGSQFAVVRYNTNGTLDTTFNGTGAVVTPVGSHESVAWTVAIQSDGRIVAGGLSNNGTDFDLALARYNTNGTLDTTFNGSGILISPFGSGDDQAWSVKVQTDGRILAGGFSSNASGPDFALARFNSDGTPDTTFNGTGKVVTPIGSGDDTARAVGIEPDGRIVLAGFSSNGLNTDFAVVRYGDCGLAPPAPRAYVTNRTSNNVSVIDTGTDTLVANITVGPTPFGIAITPGYRRVYVTNQGSNNVSVIRTATNRVIATVPVGTGPIAVAITPDGTRAYVANQTSNNVSVIDTSTNLVIATIPVGTTPGGIAIGNTVNGTRAYVANSNPGSITVIRTDTNAVVTTVTTNQFGAAGIDITPDGSRVYVANFTAGTVTVLNTATNTVVTTVNTGVARYVNITPDGSRAYVSNGIGAASPVIDTATNTIIGTVGGVTSYDVAFTPDGNRAYVADGVASDVKAVDMSTRTVIHSIGTGGVNPEGVAINPRFNPRSAVRCDFDDDGRTDVSIFRPSEGNWYLIRSTAGFSVINYGVDTDTLVPGDYDGDGKADTAVYRPSANPAQMEFDVLNSSTFTVSGYLWGVPGDIPVVADYDGDGKADVAIWRPSARNWYIRNSATNTARVDFFGATGDIPLAMDYDGDGKANIAVYRPSIASWYIARSTGVPAQNFEFEPFGTVGDKLVPADYDGDGKDDIAIYRPSIGEWLIHRSSDGIIAWILFGTPTDIPVPGDYDGDGKDDIAIYRNGEWWIQRSTSGLIVASFGLSTDTPIPAKYIP